MENKQLQVAPRAEVTTQPSEGTVHDSARVREVRPLIDVYEDGESFRVLADVPGVEPSSADVKIEHPHLYIQCSRPARGGEIVRYTSTLLLPTTVDATSLSATLEHGVLEIHMSKQPAARARRIEVRAG